MSRVTYVRKGKVLQLSAHLLPVLCPHLHVELDALLVLDLRDGLSHGKWAGITTSKKTNKSQRNTTHTHTASLTLGLNR